MTKATVTLFCVNLCRMVYGYSVQNEALIENHYSTRVDEVLLTHFDLVS